MADAGSIGTYRTGAVNLRSAPILTGSTLNSSVAGTISGTVKQGGVRIPYVRVTLHYRKNGMLIASAETDASGAFSFPELELARADYFVVATDLPYNALIFDQVAPV